MKNVAIICELNPLHNGHQALFDYARSLIGYDGNIIAIMSGNYVQRGDIGVVDKWIRANNALFVGADVVLDLPPYFSSSSAQFFAENAVSIANHLRNIDYLLFGSESGSIEYLSSLADNVVFDGPINGTSSYAREIEQVTGTALGSNDILAVEYLKALKNTNSKIVPITMKRVGNSAEGSASIDEPTYSSALSIRNAIKSGDFDKISGTMEKTLEKNLKKSIESYGGVPDFDAISPYIFGKILEIGPRGLKKLPFVSEGLENKIYKEVASGKYSTVSELADACTSKRYTRSRIRRILVSVATGNTIEYLNYSTALQYIRILGIKESKLSYINSINNIEVPVIVGNVPADYKTRFASNPLCVEMLEKMALSTDLYGLCMKNPLARKAGREFTTPLIKI